MAHYDVIVVGAGIEGSSIAYSLVKAGKKVLLLEQFPLPHTRGSSHGQSRITSQVHSDALHVRLIKDSVTMWRTLEKEAKEDLFLQCGALSICSEGSELWQERVRDMQAGVKDYETINPEAFRSRYPMFQVEENLGAILDLGAGILNANRAIAAFQSVFKTEGGILKDRSHVTSIIPGIEVKVETKDTVYTAQSVVIAAGSWAGRFASALGIDAPSLPRKALVFYWKVANDEDSRLYHYNNMPCFYNHTNDDERRNFYGLPIFEYPGLLKICLESSPPCDPDHRDQVDYMWVEQNICQAVKRTFPGLADKPAITEHCMITITPDRMPYIDKHPLHSNIVFAFGFSEYTTSNTKTLRMHDENEDPPEAYEMEMPREDTAKQPFVPPASGTKLEQPIVSVGDLFAALGNPGRMALVIFIAVSFNFFSITTNHAIGVFFVYTPEHECVPDFVWNTTASEPDLTHDSPDSNHSTHLGNSPYDTNRQSISVNHDACYVTISNASDSSNVTRSCKPGEWHYKLSGSESTTVTEWDLVCDYAYLGNLANTLYYVGVTISGFSIAFISDTIGRKVAILLCLYSLVFIGLGITFCTNFVLFMCLRTLMGLAAQALMTTSYIQIVEMFPPAHRGKAGAGIQSMWGIAMVYLSLAAWGLQNWRYIQLACTVPAILSAIYLLWMPESLRWLLSRGKVNRASKVVKRIYRFNGATDKRCLDYQLVTRLASRRKEEQGTFMDLCRSPRLRRNTIIFAVVACAINLGYWGITYNSSKILGNRYLSFLLGAVAEFIVLTMNIYVVNRFGRKKPLMFYFFLGSTCCMTLSFLHQKSNMAASMAIATVGRLAMSGCFSAGDLYAAELFPTVIRTTGVSVYVLAGRLGGILTPQVFTLGEYTFQELPLLIFGGTSLAGLLLTMLLPDTSAMELADTVMEAEASAATMDKDRNLSQNTRGC